MSAVERWESLPEVNRLAAVHWLAVIAGQTVLPRTAPTTEAARRGRDGR